MGLAAMVDLVLEEMRQQMVDPLLDRTMLAPVAQAACARLRST